VTTLVFGRPFVKRFALCYGSVVCLSVLSVTLVHCDQTVGRIKTKLDMQVDLGPGHIVLDGDLAPLPKWGRSPLPQFSAHFYCSQTAGCIKIPLGTEVGLSPGYFVLHGDPAPLLKKGTDPQFSADVHCGQTATWIKMPLGTEVGLGPDDIVLDGDPAILRKKAHPHPILGPCLL